MLEGDQHGPYEVNAKVTICSDAKGKHPKRLGFVKRHGNGAWRLEGSSEWYDYSGKRVAVDHDRFKEYATTTCFAFPYKEGDEKRIEEENGRVVKLAEAFNKLSRAERKLQSIASVRADAVRRANQRVFDAKYQIENLRTKLRFAETELQGAVENQNRVLTAHSDLILERETEATIAQLKDKLKILED